MKMPPGGRLRVYTEKASIAAESRGVKHHSIVEEK
jgi:hypothetical protein